MALPLKDRTKITIKKVLILGYDGTGKSTYAEQYCNENQLKPIVIDIDDTNYTDLPIIDLKEYLPSSIGLNYDKKYYDAILQIIKDIEKEGPVYDTIVVDGISSLIEELVSKAKGLQKYGDRKDRFDTILKKLEKTEKNLIFVGQKDIEPIHTADKSSNACVFKINSIVNEKYECYKENNQFLVDTLKYRKPATIKHQNTKNETEKVVAEPVLPRQKPTPNTDLQVPDPEPLRTIVNKIIRILRNEGREPIRKNIWIKATECCKDGRIKTELKDDLQTYIMSHCPEELE